MLLRVDIPTDLKPAIYITNSDNILENSYTSEEALLGYDIILLSKGKNINTNRLKSFIKYTFPKLLDIFPPSISKNSPCIQNFAGIFPQAPLLCAISFS